MVTASHLPIDRNGFKLCTKSGGYTKCDVKVLTTEAAAYARQLLDHGELGSIGDGNIENVSLVLCSWFPLLW